MKVYNKKVINKVLGQYGIFEAGKKSNHIIHKVKYLAGVPELDRMKNSGKLNTDTSPVIVRKKPMGLEFEFTTGLTNSLRIGLRENQFNFWTIEHSHDIKENNTQSIIGNAALGGLFFGKAGAVAGGLSAFLDKAEHILSIEYLDGENERMALFSTTSNSAGKVYDFMMKNLSSKYKNPTDLKEQKEIKKEVDVKSGTHFSVADELQKLAELKKSGILSEQEFVIQKQKLLNQG
tara:strand:- start:1280 stop:1981 length:702 start_codon:yes stop_codon:yes gene_type:complete